MIGAADSNLDSSASQIDQDVILAARDLSDTIKSIFGIDVPSFSSSALVQLRQMDSLKKNEIKFQLRNSTNWLNSVRPQKEDQTSFDEVFYAQSAIKKLNFKVSDRFWQTLTSDQVVEIYGLDMCQIYRSFNFFKFSGYSILDISVFEWFKLWERPKLILNTLMDEVKEVISNKLEVMASQVPTHILREVMDTHNTIAFEPRACEMRFHNYGILTDIHSNEIRGFICSASGEVIARGYETLKFGTV